MCRIEDIDKSCLLYTNDNYWIYPVKIVKATFAALDIDYYKKYVLCDYRDSIAHYSKDLLKYVREDDRVNRNNTMYKILNNDVMHNIEDLNTEKCLHILKENMKMITRLCADVNEVKLIRSIRLL